MNNVNIIYMNKKLFMCSFCKRNQTEVKKLIVGPNVYICDFCTNICAEILHEEDPITQNVNNNTITSLTPEEIYKKLDEVVAGQEDAKKELSIAAYLHYLRMNEDLKHQKNKESQEENKNFKDNILIPLHEDNDSYQKLKKYNMLLIGPTGSGKTLLMQTLAKILDVAYIIVDANSLTEAGYVGEDVEGIISKLFNSVYYEGHPNLQECMRKTKYGFIFIDEIDKKYATEGTMANRDVSGRGVQQNFLKIIEGTDINVFPGNKKNPHQEPITINTSSIFVVGGGAFQGLNQIIRQSIKQSFSLGLMTRDMHQKDNNKNIPLWEDDQTTIIKHFHRENLVSFGMIPELVGRFECITFLNKLTENHLVQILKEKKNNLMEEYNLIFQIHNVKIIYKEELLRAIAKKAISENTGARGLRSIVHKLFSPIIFTMPTLCGGDNKNKTFTLTITAQHLDDNLPLEILENVPQIPQEQKQMV